MSFLEKNYRFTRQSGNVHGWTKLAGEKWYESLLAVIGSFLLAYLVMAILYIY